MKTKQNYSFLNANYKKENFTESKQDSFLNSFTPGINIGGFDIGKGCIGTINPNIQGASNGGVCITNDAIDFACKSGFKILRFPIFPCRIFNNTDKLKESDIIYKESYFNDPRARTSHSRGQRKNSKRSGT